jgi:hypothetical protein
MEAMRRALELMEKNFIARISRKTGWGKNEIINEFKEALNETLMQLVDEILK